MPTRRTLLCTLALMSLPLALAAGQEPVASLRGTVTDSVRHGPLVGAIVVASSVPAGGADDFHDYTALTDAHGQFAITSLRPGIYALTVKHPWLDSSGLRVPARQIMSDTVYSSRGLTRLQQNTDRVCMPALYVNGIRGVHTMNDISPDTIYGIEIYTSRSITPPQYPAESCGAIFIWTK